MNDKIDKTQNLPPQERLQKISSKKNYNLAKIPKVFNELLSFMDNNIRKQFRSFSLLAICGASDKAKFIIDKHLQKSFSEMTIKQRLDMYQKAVNYGEYMLNSNLQKQQIQQQINREMKVILNDSRKEFFITIHEGFRSSQEIKIQIEGFKFNSKKNFSVDLQNYLIRKSKKKNPQCYVLQAVNNTHPETIRFSFANSDQEIQNIKVIEQIVTLAFKNTIKNMLMQTKIIESPNKSDYMRNSDRSYGRLRSTQKNVQQAPKQTTSISDVIDSKKLLQFSHFIAETKRKQIYNSSSEQLIAELLHSKKNMNKTQKQTNQKSENIFNHVLESQHFIKQPFTTYQYHQSTLINNIKNLVHHKNIFQQILPDYSLREIDNPRLFQNEIWRSNKTDMIIYEHTSVRSRYKVKLILLNHHVEEVYKLLINAELLKKWSHEVDQSQIKITLSTDNCLICYQKHKRINNWFKQRDYLYLRHAFTYKGARFICDKSIQHTSFIPFQSIQRGFIEHFVTKIKLIQNGKISVTLDLNMRHEGYLGEEKKRELTLRFLKGYENIQQYLEINKRALDAYCNLDWNIDWIESVQASRPQLDFRSEQFAEGSQIEHDHVHIQQIDMQSEEFFSVIDEEQTNQNQNIDKKPATKIQVKKQQQFEQKRQVEEIQQNPIVISMPSQIQLDSQGYCILPQKYIKKKHILTPLVGYSEKPQKKYDNIILRNDFVEDTQSGIRLINKKKIEAQDNVLSFIMKTMKKNLFSGKSILSISLPVEIFKEDSNTQRLCESLSLGPLLLEKACQTHDHVERMKWAIAFGLSNSILYFYIQKPFNPILGQTYQGFINGCPVYAEQTSHHPPITSLYFVGRGYRVHASIQSKVFLHLNSGDGVNAGFYTIEFDDGQVIKFQTAPGELSGFTIGDRKYRYKEYMYVFDERNLLFGELLFEQPNLSMFSKKTWKYGDQLGGSIMKVTQGFMKKLLQSSEKIHPKPKQIQQTLSQIDGRWLYYLNFDGKKYYNITQDVPYKMINYEYSLNSDARFRQDLIYRTKNDLVKSQIHKQYLENKQRKDRKQRQKYNGQEH